MTVTYTSPFNAQVAGVHVSETVTDGGYINVQDVMKSELLGLRDNNDVPYTYFAVRWCLRCGVVNADFPSGVQLYQGFPGKYKIGEIVFTNALSPVFNTFLNYPTQWAGASNLWVSTDTFQDLDFLTEEPQTESRPFILSTLTGVPAQRERVNCTGFYFSLDPSIEMIFNINYVAFCIFAIDVPSNYEGYYLINL